MTAATESVLRGRGVRVLLAAVLCLTVWVAMTAPAQAQATRTWVHSLGDDANPCSRTAPCATLTGARGKTANGGEINAIDAGEFGRLTLTTSFTVDLGSVGGRIANGGTSGILVNAGPTGDVVLRGLEIIGVNSGGAGCAYTGVTGIDIQSARSVTIEDSSISAQATAIRIAPSATTPTVALKNVTIRNACTAGVDVAPTGTAKATVSITRSSISAAGTGLRVADEGTVWLASSSVFSNAIGLETIGTGTINAYVGNQVYGNAVDGAPTAVLGRPEGGPGAVGPTGDAGADGAAGSPGATGAQGPPPFQVLLPKTRLATTAVGKRVSLRYLATDVATTTLTVKRGRTTVATVRGRARSGKNTITWNGRRGRKAAAAGTYTLVLAAKSADGTVAKTRAKVRLKRGR